jgi:hypothetical protein
MKLPAGKTLYLWRPGSVEKGNVTNTVLAALDMGIAIVSLKVGSGVYKYPFNNYNLRPLRDALGSAGILVYGWHYVYGDNEPASEAEIALQQVSSLDLDGYEIDAESHYKNYPYSQATELSARFHDITQRADIPLMLTTYRYPDVHPEFPWRGFLANVDVFVPQVYWQPPPSSPTLELDKSIGQWAAKCAEYGYPVKPFLPAGRLYIGDGYPTPGPSANEIIEFINRCKALGLRGCHFWSFDNLYTHAYGAARAEAVASVPWEVITPDPDPDLRRIVEDHERRIKRLETFHEPIPPGPGPEPVPEPVGVPVIIKEDQPAMGISGYNDNGVPTIDVNLYKMYNNNPNLKFFEGDKVYVLPDAVRGQGNTRWFRLTETVPEPAFVDKDKVTKLQ